MACLMPYPLKALNMMFLSLPLPRLLFIVQTKSAIADVHPVG